MSSPFHQRFNINIGLQEAQRRFINRTHNLILHIDSGVSPIRLWYGEVRLRVFHTLGERRGQYNTFEAYIRDDFYKNLQVLEAIYQVLGQVGTVSGYTEEQVREKQRQHEQLIRQLIQESEVDLGIRWENGQFLPSGAKLLDEKLVNENLQWLTENGYAGVLEPFQKGLNHFLHAEKRPELISDVITDMYEALEALAKILNGNERDLSSNRERFIKNVDASAAYKQLLKDYIDYANNFRHASSAGGTKPMPSKKEVESFIYLTGVFIRLAI